MADYHYTRVTSWAEAQMVHARFFTDYNHQPHWAHRDRGNNRQSPAAVLGWVQGAWCDPANLDRLFRLRSTRVLNAGGSLRFRHWRLYGERGLAGERAAVQIHGEILTLEYETETLVQYRVALEADGHRLRKVSDPRFFPTAHQSPQPFLPPLDEVAWQPAQQLAPYAPRRRWKEERHPPGALADCPSQHHRLIASGHLRGGRPSMRPTGVKEVMARRV